VYFYESNKHKGENWFRSGYGRWVAATEYRLCKEMLQDVFGLYAAQLGGGRRTLVSVAPVRHYCMVNTESGSVRAQWQHLPFKSDSMDLLLLAHALEASDDPHAVLREAARVLRPEGRVVIVGFNPWSMLALVGGAPWRRRWLSATRLKDWLTLLDLHPIGGAYAVFLPAWKRLRWMEKAGRRWWPLAGGVFFLHAVKRKYGMHLIAPSFKNRVRQGGEFATVGSEKRIQSSPCFND